MANTGYFLIYEQLKLEMEQGRLLPGDALPPEKVLADKYGVSRTTLRRAMGQLESEKRIVRRPGIGSFVTSREAAAEPLAELRIGVEMPDQLRVSPFLLATLSECRKAAEEQRAHILIKNSDELCRGEGLDAAIFTLVDDDNYQRIAELAKRMPVILINRITSLPDLSYVAVDYAETVFRVIDRMLRNGAGDIVFIGGPGPGKAYAPYHRELGFRRALAANRRSVDEDMIVPLRTAYDPKFIAQLLRHRQPDVIFIGSEAILPSAFAALETVQSELTKPVYPICFDDVAGYDCYARMSLSGISMPFRLMAQRAVEFLISCCREGRQPPIRELFAPNIVVRDCPFLI